MKLSIVVVCLNPGNLIKDTLEGISRQTFEDYEVLIKDGGSTDGTKEYIEKQISEGVGIYSKVRFVTKKDSCIYDAMNQAVELSDGQFVIFMNCGDSFYSEDVLTKIFNKEIPSEGTILYGDTYFRKSDSVSKAAPQITPSVCYRNIPCHQSIIYSKDVLSERGFDTSLKIRADYEHFLYSYFEKKRQFIYLDLVIADYEGGGFSESRENAALDRKEYSLCVKKYVPLKNRFVYRAILILTLHKVRKLLADSKRFGKIYQKLKGMLYR